MPRTEIELDARKWKPDTKRTGPQELFDPCPPPPTALGEYRLLSPNAAVRVSPLCIGGMSIGDQWKGGFGKGLNYDEACELLDAYYEAGGNFIDTAGNYQDEHSEVIIGQWMEERKNRDEIVLATKYTTSGLNRSSGNPVHIRINYHGNGKKNLRLSLEASLKKLRTTYIDLYYVHWWDYTVKPEDMMQQLHEFVLAGKILFLGISDCPAWIVAQCNTIASERGWTPFSVYQGEWGIHQRDMERDIIPMCRSLGLAVAPYSVLGGGSLKTSEEAKERGGGRFGGGHSDKQEEISQAMQEVAKDLGKDVTIQEVAIAWARTKVWYCYPILGGTSVKHLKSSIKALSLKLSEEQMKKLDDIAPLYEGFPWKGYGHDAHWNKGGQADTGLVKMGGSLTLMELPK